MTTLENLISDASERKSLVTDCERLVDSEVRGKSGLGGAVVKTAYNVVKAVKPGIIPESIDALLDEFVQKLDPMIDQYREAGGQATFESYVTSRRPDVANELLGVTDARARRSTNKTLVKAYEKLRPKGKQHVEQAVPAIGRVVDRYLPKLG